MRRRCVYGFDAIAFSNERSASVGHARIRRPGSVNHQWSKSHRFRARASRAIQSRAIVAADLDYFSLLRPLSELAVTRAFARTRRNTTMFFRAATGIFVFAATSLRIDGADNVPNVISCFSRSRHSSPSRVCSAFSDATCSTMPRSRQPSMRCWNTVITNRSSASAKVSESRAAMFVAESTTGMARGCASRSIRRRDSAAARPRTTSRIEPIAETRRTKTSCRSDLLEIAACGWLTSPVRARRDLGIRSRRAALR